MGNHRQHDDDWDGWASVYAHYAANRRNFGRSGLRETGEAVGMSKQSAKYRVEALEGQARRMAYIAARSAALRAFFLRELLSHAGEPWFETYAGFPLDTPDAVVEQVIREVRSAYP